MHSHYVLYSVMSLASALRGDYTTKLLHELKRETAFHKLFCEHLVLLNLISFQFCLLFMLLFWSCNYNFNYTFFARKK